MSETEQELQQLLDYQKQLRSQEKNLRARERALSSQASLASGPNLKDHFNKFLPAHLVPGNVGPLQAVTWGFFQEVTFDFGANPSIGPTSRAVSSFQVTQEAAFLLLAISRNADTTTAGGYGPWQIDIQDRQSTRQLNDLPIPLQMIGTASIPSVLPTPYLIMPNAIIQVTMSSWLTGAPQATVGSGRHQIMFFGYRVRVEDAGVILSSIFS
jgi:hypothetical protein